MPKVSRGALIALLAILVGSCAAPVVVRPTPSAISSSILIPTTQPARLPAPGDYIMEVSKISSIPKYDPTSTASWQVDLSSKDLTELDLTRSLTDLAYASFNSKTQWPSKMPADFDPQKIIETGKDPGLGFRSLHDQGVLGKGIGIAIIDQPLLVDHKEYRDRIRLYEEINALPDSKAVVPKPTKHGAAVTSIAVGKTTGVAPQADVYYIGSWTGDWDLETENFTWNFKYYAQAIQRILELNRSLPADHKIRVIAMQVGWLPGQAGYEEITAVVDEAKKAGIFVISSSLRDTYGWNFEGLGREPLADPNELTSYGPGLWWQQRFFNRGSLSNTLLIPMDSRTTASPTGIEDFVFYRDGGQSWVIPYLAGMYALVVQVKPDITPEDSWDAALQTGKTIPIEHDGKEYQFGVILDPQALIDEIK